MRSQRKNKSSLTTKFVFWWSFLLLIEKNKVYTVTPNVSKICIFIIIYLFNAPAVHLVRLWNEDTHTTCTIGLVLSFEIHTRALRWCMLDVAMFIHLVYFVGTTTGPFYFTNAPLFVTVLATVGFGACWLIVWYQLKTTSWKYTNSKCFILTFNHTRCLLLIASIFILLKFQFGLTGIGWTMVASRRKRHILTNHLYSESHQAGVI